MAVRASIPFITAFNAAVRPTGHLAAMATNADLKAELLAVFNRSYKIGYEFPWQNGTMWEDARTWAEITPSSGLISWTTLGDARSIEIYTKDPRETRLADRVTFYPDQTGITVNDALATVWVSWIPGRFHFNTTTWATVTAYVVGDVRTLSTSGECYRCLVAHTSGTFATDLSASKWVLMPVLDVLEEFLIRHVHATWMRERERQVETGASLQGDALTELLEIHRAELRRNRIGANP